MRLFSLVLRRLILLNSSILLFYPSRIDMAMRVEMTSYVPGTSFHRAF